MKAKYFQINLNKASNRLDRYEQMQKRKKLVSFIAFYAALLVIAAAVFYRSYTTEAKIDQLRDEVATIDEKIARLESSTDYLSPEDIFALSEVTTDRMIWSEKISVLGNILPKDVTITELDYNDSRDVFLIKGISKVQPGMKDLDLVVAIINVVKSNKDFSSDFSDIKFQSSQRIKHNDQEMVKFEIACLI
jgi:outer membrane murein-binding lipoprotein Lpp